MENSLTVPLEVACIPLGTVKEAVSIHGKYHNSNIGSNGNYPSKS